MRVRVKYDHGRNPLEADEALAWDRDELHVEFFSRLKLLVLHDLDHDRLLCLRGQEVQLLVNRNVVLTRLRGARDGPDLARGGGLRVAHPPYSQAHLLRHLRHGVHVRLVLEDRIRPLLGRVGLASWVDRAVVRLAGRDSWSQPPRHVLPKGVEVVLRLHQDRLPRDSADGLHAPHRARRALRELVAQQYVHLLVAAGQLGVLLLQLLYHVEIFLPSGAA
mmetsp:Transcript_67354/g.191125  ORF Transcript_67354/g.191125 Transcript_67354/m.191125 type:complete len:220 (+) Transcript_67354:841-1500(+)